MNATQHVLITNNACLSQVAEEKAGKLSEARLQMEQQVAAAVAQEAGQAAASQAKLNSAAQAEASGAERDSAAEADMRVQSVEEQAAESQGQLLGEVRGFMKVARDGIKQRQSALQYARSTWQVTMIRVDGRNAQTKEARRE